MGLELDDDGKSARVTREMESGMNELFRLALPAVIQVQAGINHPRYASLKGIMQAKRKPIDVVDAQLGAEQLVIEKLSYPPEKSAGKVFDNGVDAVPEVVRLLREEARLI